GRSKKGGDASLQRGNLGSYSIVGGVLQTGIKISVCFQVKKLSHFIGGIIFKGGTLINGKGAGLSFGRRIACVKTFGFQFRVVDVHIQVLLSCINHLYPPFSAGGVFALSCHQVDLLDVFHVELFKNTDGPGVFEAAPESQIVDFSFVQIQSQIMKADRHFYGTEEVLHGFYSRKGCAFKIRIAWNVEYISGKLCKTLWILLIYIACPASP